MQSASSTAKNGRRPAAVLYHAVNYSNHNTYTVGSPTVLPSPNITSRSRLPLQFCGKRKAVTEKKSTERRKRPRRNGVIWSGKTPLAQSLKSHQQANTMKAVSLATTADTSEIQEKKSDSSGKCEPFLSVLSQLGRNRAPLLAQEILKLNVSRFPMETMAEKLANKMIADHKAVESSLDVAMTVRSLLNELRQTIMNPSNDIIGILDNFDDVSQSFGLKNAVNHLEFLDQCISCVCSKLSRKNE